ncbi:MAG: hypothetical protein JWM96_459, partial [Alphaproteobacteria bacterium]|nr:hypothetical protein [Alphaproteobacteria bacterium]
SVADVEEELQARYNNAVKRLDLG